MSSTRRVSRRLPCYDLLILTALIIVAHQTVAQTGLAQPSQQEILQELATAQRMLADEEYIGGEQVKARAEYEEASTTVGRLNTDGGFLTEANITLQKDEIQYRKLLLERQESFWGLDFSARPLNPVAQFVQFEFTFNRFKALVSDVDHLADRLKAGETATFGPEDQQIQNERDKRVAELQQGIAEIRLRDANVRRAMYQDRKKAIQDRQMAIVAEISSLQKQVEDRSSALNATLASSLVSAVVPVGLPPDALNIVAGAAKGDYSGVIGAVVQQYGASPDLVAGLPGQLKSLATSAQEAAEDYQKVRQTLTDIQEKAGQGAALLKAVQSNDRDKLIAIGGVAVRNLSPATYDQLQNGLGKLSNIDGALKLAGNGTAVRASIAEYIGSTPDLASEVGSLMKNYLNTETEGFAWRYQHFLISELTTAKTGAEQLELLTAITRGWAGSFVQDILAPKGGVIRIAVALGSNCSIELDCTTWLIDQLAKRGIPSQIVSISVAGDVTVNVNGEVAARFSLNDVAKLTSGRALETSITAIRPDADALVARVQGADHTFVDEVVRSLPDVDFDRDIAPMVKSLEPERERDLFHTLTSPGVGGIASPGSKDMVALVVGNDIAKKTVFLTVPKQKSASIDGHQDTTAPAVTDPSQEMILSAMKASGPYGYAAAVAIQLFSGIAQNAVAIEQINEKAHEDHELTVEMLHITGFEADMNRDEAIATLEQRIATAQAFSADSRSSLYEQALLDQGTQATALEEKLRRRLPLIFLLSEQLRGNFDSLDHSVGYWENDLIPDGRFLERTVRSDPQFRRLGLDPDISLYEWFRRDTEGQRQDLDALLVHWEAIDTLINGVCAKLHCTLNDPQMGQVEMTEIISVRKQLINSADWEAAAQSHTLMFTILPQSLPNIPAREGLRLVHVAGAVSDNAQNYRANPNIVLRHSGLGYVSAAGKGYRETLEVSGDLTPTFVSDDKDSTQLQAVLQQRWSPNPTLRPLEGYPLYGLYKLWFPPDFDFVSSDVVLRFYYEWPVNSTLLDQRDVGVHFKCASSSGRPVSVASSDVRLLIKNDTNGLPTLPGTEFCTLLEATR